MQGFTDEADGDSDCCLGALPQYSAPGCAFQNAPVCLTWE